MNDDNSSPPPKKPRWKPSMNLDSDSDSSDEDIPQNVAVAANWDDPFYKFSITLLTQFIQYNVRDVATRVTDENIQRLAHDIMVRIFQEEGKDMDAVYTELTKHILILRYAKEAKFDSFLSALRDVNFYENTQPGMTSMLVGQAINDVLFEKFGSDFFEKAKTYIELQYKLRKQTPRMIQLSYSTSHPNFPTYDGNIPEGNMPWILNKPTQLESSRNMGMALGGGGGAEMEMKRQQEIEEQSLRNKEKLAEMMKKQKSKAKKSRFFEKDTSKTAQMERAMFLERKQKNKELFQTIEDKAAQKRDKKDKEYKSKFSAGQKVRVYRYEDKKGQFDLASIIEVNPNGLLVRYEENDSEVLLEWRIILNENYNKIQIVSEDKKEIKEFLSTSEAMKKGGGLSPEFLSTSEAMKKGGGLSPSCSSSKCDNCSMIIKKKPFQSYQKKGKGKKQEYVYKRFCSIGCMEKEKF